MNVVIQWCNTNSGFVMALLTVVYVGTTLFMYFSNRKSVSIQKAQLKEMAHERELRDRPYVILSLESIRNGIICLKIENIGNSVAIDVCIELDSDFIENVLSIMGNENIETINKKKMYLAPKQTHYIALSGPATFSELVKTPLIGIITYNGKYKETVTIDFKNYIGGLIYESPLGDIAEHLKKIAEASKRLSK